MYSYSNLTANQINSVFRGCLPCGCYDDPDKIYKIPRYNVRLRFSNTEFVYRGKRIAEVIVECDCCGSTVRYNVESRDICENEINW